MIKYKRMRFIKTENDINYYVFTPTLFNLYYNDGNVHSCEPSHRKSLSHKLHMWLYIFGGGYNILYAEKNGEILSYIVFVKANNKIIKNCEANDYYTIFLWTYPEYRGKGLATLMAKIMLNDLNLDYNNFYKTISKDNVSSIKVAEKCGFYIECDSIKTKFLHTIHKVEKGEQYLYRYSKK